MHKQFNFSLKLAPDVLVDNIITAQRTLEITFLSNAKEKYLLSLPLIAAFRCCPGMVSKPVLVFLSTGSKIVIHIVSDHGTIALVDVDAARLLTPFHGNQRQYVCSQSEMINFHFPTETSLSLYCTVQNNYTW